MSYKVRGLVWNIHKALIGYKLVAYDCFGNEFARTDLKGGEDEFSQRVVAFKHNKQLEYKKAILSTLEPKGSFSEGDLVEKKSGSWWEGKVVGFYSTEQTPEGYAVQLNGVPNGPVQIYPVQALKKQ